MTTSKQTVDPRLEQKKLLIFGSIVLLFIVGLAITFNQTEGTRLRSDMPRPPY
jgi:hypothetical protein